MRATPDRACTAPRVIARKQPRRVDIAALVMPTNLAQRSRINVNSALTYVEPAPL